MTPPTVESVLRMVCAVAGVLLLVICAECVRELWRRRRP